MNQYLASDFFDLKPSKKRLEELGFRLFSTTFIRIYALYNRHTGAVKGLLSPHAEKKLEEYLWTNAAPCVTLADAQRDPWDNRRNENGEVTNAVGNLLAAQFLKDLPDYANRKYKEGSTAKEQYDARVARMSKWLDERVKYGQFQEYGASYQDYTVSALINLRDFTDNPALRTKTEMFLDLAFASMAEETLCTQRGGPKSRSKGHDRTFKPYKLLFDAPGGTITEMEWFNNYILATSDYYPPKTVEDLARDISGRGDYILLIMPDQMRGDCLSILGHPILRTPHLDKLAQEGMLFRRAYSTVPSCIPARYGLLTGLSPQTSGVVGFAFTPITTPTLPGLLGNAGYTTVLVGREMHQDKDSGNCGYQRQVLGSTYVTGDEYDKYLRQVSPECGGTQELVKSLKLDFNRWPAASWPFPDEQHPTAWVARQARQVIETASTAQPLFLTASFYAPHPPLFPPRKYFEAYLESDLPQPAHGDWVDWAALSPTGDERGQRIRLEGETLRRAQAGYFGLIEHLDDQIGPLIANFKARSEKAGRPWLIVFTSDHGEMLGDHGYFRKCEPYEGSANIPFIVAGSPSLGLKAAAHCEQPVCLEDIMPTLLYLAHCDVPKMADTYSLVPVLRGGSLARKYLHIEHAPCYSQAQAFHALTDGRFKYIWRSEDGAEQLFDLKTDPHEEHDLSKLPDVKVWRQRLVQRLVSRPEGFSTGEDLVPGRPYPPIQKGR